MRPKLGRLLRVTPDELAILLSPMEEKSSHHSAGAQSIPDRIISENGLDGGDLDAMHRRDLLRLLSIAGTLTAIPESGVVMEAGHTAPARNAGDIEQHELLNAHLWQIFALSSSKSLVYPVVRQQLDVLIHAMEKSHSPDIHRRLCILASDLFQMTGEILFDRDRYTDAAYCYATAANAAKEAGAVDLWACALTRHAFISLYDKQFAHAVSILSVAARVAQQGDTQFATRHWVAAVQAQAFAGLGDTTRCDHALNFAEQVLMLDGPINNGGWLRFDGSRLAEERGTCYLTLGRGDDAYQVLTQALDQAVSPRRRAGVLTDLTLLGVQRRDLDQVLQYGGEAIDLAEQTKSAGYIGRKLHAVRTQLGPLLPDSRVAELSGRIARLSAVAGR